MVAAEVGQAVDSVFRRVIAEASLDLHTVASTDGRYLFVSPTSEALFGWPAAELVGRNQAEFVHPDDVVLVENARRLVLEGCDESSSAVWRFRCADGAYCWTEVLTTVVNEQGESLVVSTVRDIRGRKQSELDLHRQATTDPLTGVANRIVFMDRLQQSLRRLERRDGIVAVLFLDLDRFKLVNDTVGHLKGDTVLLQVADRLRRFLRTQDTLARLGGDEFAILIEDLASSEEAAALADRVVEAGRPPFGVDGEQFICTTSVGVSVTSDPRHSAHGLLQEADLALYKAKDRGRDTAELFDADMRTRAVGRLATERMLRRAIDENRLRVEYQPIVDLCSASTVAAEALVRVWDPEHSCLIDAGKFIGVAEEAGLLGPVDDWVLGEAIRQVAAWRETFVATTFEAVAINLTARHLAAPGFAQSVLDLLAANAVSAPALRIEVNERVLMEASNSAMASLRLLREAGVRTGLDDFGTGYSSLSYLRLLPLDFVKIDRSFISAITNGTERAIVASIIDLCHALGIVVVAEGVETRAQRDHLVELGCDQAQGFCFGSAGPPRAIEDRVADRPAVVC